MWELFLIVLGFSVGRIFGMVNKDQDQIDIAYEKIEVNKQLWLDAEQRAESWKRRYLSLVPEEKEINGS